MSWAAVAGAAVGVVGSVVSSRSASRSQQNAAGAATEAQQSAADAAAQAQLDMYNQSRADQAGYRARGEAAGNRLAHLLGIQPQEQVQSLPNSAGGPISSGAVLQPGSMGTMWRGETPKPGMGRYAADLVAQQPSVQQQPSQDFGSLMRQFTGQDLTNDPGYQFRLAEGNRALDRSAAARGGLFSGAQLRGLDRYNQDYASTEFTNAFNRDQSSRNNIYNMLAGVSGTGQTATNQVGQQGTATAANIGQQGIYTGAQIGQNMIGAGNARASGYLATGNALQNGLNQGWSAYNQSQNRNLYSNPYSGYQTYGTDYGE